MDWSAGLWMLIGMGLGVGTSWGFLGTRSVVKTDSPADPVQLYLAKIQSLQSQLQCSELAYQMAITVGQFQAGYLARISHELRSPLSSIIGTHQLILADLCNDSAEEREFVSLAHAATLRMVSMLDQILRVAKLAAGRSRLKLQPLSLKTLFEEIDHLTCIQAQDRGLHLQVIYPHVEGAVVADQQWLQQVLLNLVATAIDAMTTGSIRLSAALLPEAGTVQIWVEDQRPDGAWAEPIDLLRMPPAPELATADHPSPGLTLLSNQMILAQMQGHLELVAPALPQRVSQPEDHEGFTTRICCTLPLATAYCAVNC
ncbi:hypothetical protein DO97_20360 [Neosynechococcus sphagnicola sy1]|uniref:histidine kinase n=1 Tax=Neosynechococcus sphagnicola sy1 TaxID=1497020 RepID=A0A098TNI3_9CYAN|nr:sensor histidine kinase [Neosynechococcus sphagnicola]KGF73427.1 hypothetical protein DO97_20360 [Neosynechococcus sphagnicola sy1]